MVGDEQQLTAGQRSEILAASGRPAGEAAGEEIPNGLKVELELKERFEALKIGAKRVEATSKSIDISKSPDFFDRKRFSDAQKTCQKYYTNISLGSSTGLILLLQIESILIPLLKTGKSRSVPDLYDRYVATARYIRSLYESDFYKQDSLGWRNIIFVRAMHERIFKLMKADPSVEQNYPEVWVNQYDMCLTQFAFVGLFLLRPDKCGAYHITRAELMDVAYYWRLISYYFGIEDRYNLFVFHHDFEKQTKYLALILGLMKTLLDGDQRQQQAAAAQSLAFSPRNEVGLKMAEGFMFAFEDLSTEASMNILDHWWSPYISLTGRKQLAPYSLSDLWKLLFFLLYFKVLFRSELLLGWINAMYKRKFDKFSQDGDRIKQKLAKKYRNHICE